MNEVWAMLLMSFGTVAAFGLTVRHLLSDDAWNGEIERDDY